MLLKPEYLGELVDNECYLDIDDDYSPAMSLELIQNDPQELGTLLDELIEDKIISFKHKFFDEHVRFSIKDGDLIVTHISDVFAKISFPVDRLTMNQIINIMGTLLNVLFRDAEDVVDIEEKNKKTMLSENKQILEKAISHTDEGLNF